MTRLTIPAGVSLAQARTRLDVPSLAIGALAASGVAAASSTRATATATADATPHTVGAWAELIAATTDRIEWVEIQLTAVTAAGATVSSTLLNIGIGAAAAEVAVVSGLQVGWSAGTLRYRIPINIPIGSRVSIQCQGAVTLQAVSLIAVFGADVKSKRSPKNLVTMGGANILTTSRGVDLPAGGTVNTKTAWTEIEASTAQPFGALLLCLGGAADASMAASNLLVDIGIGPSSGAVTAIVSDVPYLASAQESILGQCTPLFPCNVPRGAKLWARWAFAVNTFGVDVTLLGVPRQ